MSYTYLLKNIWLAILGLLFIAIGALSENGLLFNDNEKIDLNDQEVLKEFLSDKIKTISSLLESAEKSDSLNPNENVLSVYNQHKINYSLFKNGKEYLWQNTSFAFDKDIEDNEVGLKKVENGWYVIGAVSKGNKKIVLYYRLFFKRYEENEGLKYVFNSDVPINREIEFLPKKDEEGIFTIAKDLSGNKIEARFMGFTSKTQSLWIHLIGVILLFLYIVLFSYSESTFNSWKFVVSYMILMVAIRVCYHFSWLFTELNNTRLFSPELYASNFLSSSFGGLMLDLLILLPVILYLNHEHNPIVNGIRKWSVKKPFFAELVLNLLLLGLFVLFSHFVKQIILDSIISFNFSKFSTIDFYSYLGVFLLFLAALGTSILAFVFIKMFGKLEQKKEKLAILLTFLIILTLLIFWQNSLEFWASMMGYCIFYGMTRIFDIRKKTYSTIVFIVFYNLLLTILISYFVDFKEKEHRKSFALKALHGFDLEAEEHLLEADEKIGNNAIVQQYFGSKDKDSLYLKDYLKYNYFTGYLNKYDLRIIPFQLLNGQVKNRDKKRFGELNLIFEDAERRLGENFKSLKIGNAYGDYMGRFFVSNENDVNGAFFVTFKTKSLNRESNFFSSVNSYNSDYEDVKGYSYALYTNNSLKRSFGSYNYERKLKDKRIIGDYFFTTNQFSHYLYSADGETSLMVSNPLMSFSEWISIFLMLTLYVVIAAMVFLSVLALILSLSNRLIGFNFFKRLRISLIKVVPFLDLRSMLLSTKMHLAMFSIIMLTFAVTILVTMRYVRSNYFERQEFLLKENMNKLVKTLSKANLSNELIYKISYERDLDINIFNVDGEIEIASNNSLFNTGLIGPLLRRDVFLEFIKSEKTETIKNENLGKLNYLSSYHAIFDEDQLMYVINIPYFSQNSELEREISSYVVLIINFYGLVLIISFIIAYVLSRKLAEPLMVIRNYLGEIQIGEKNREIIWKNKDEIGMLVEKYNEMLHELENNARRFAEVNREEAWREMAKQVAHEIKNPLTPMKLQLQMLQKSWREKDPLLDEKFNRVSSLLLERIDAMSEMAIQFSSFSKMPKTKMELLNVNQVLKDMVDLQKGADNFSIIYNMDANFNVFADKEQLARVFTNIIQNARQAIPDSDIGILNIYAKEEGDEIFIYFEDNGIGMNPNTIDKVFVPNFSTKNSGMGMGMAICKKIIENLGGRITLTSELQKGTTFTVVIPRGQH